MIVKDKYKMSFKNEAKAMFSPVDLKWAILWYAGKPVAPTKKIFMYGRYPAVSIYGEKIHIHRLLMMNWEQRDLEPKEYVHHIDGDPLNSLYDNLEIQSSSEHQSQANKGRKQTPAHVAKRIDATTKTRYGHSIYENKELLGDKR